MTRRESLRLDGMPSLSKMHETYFSTARVVITSFVNRRVVIRPFSGGLGGPPERRIRYATRSSAPGVDRSPTLKGEPL
jgi:hypothetical protein